MEGPKPFTVVAGKGPPPNESETALATKLARVLETRQKLGALQQLRLAYPLPDGNGYMVATNTGGVTNVVLYRDEDIEHEPFKLDAPIPMLYSGRITKSSVMPGEKAAVAITKMTKLRLLGYDQSKLDTIKDVLELDKFVVPVDQTRHFEFKSPDGIERLYTQYSSLYPTWFSGTMAAVVQIAAGYGKLSKVAGEINYMRIPEDVMEDITEEKAGVYPMSTGRPVDTGQIQFDYKHHRAQAIFFDNEQNPWIAVYSPKGVHVMQLPLIPETATTAFKNYIEEVGDDEITAILEKFKGMPTGETVPLGPLAFDAWVKTGALIKVCDTADFYAFSPICDGAISWQFSETTNEAVATCYYIGDDNMQRARYYKSRVTIQAAKDYFIPGNPMEYPERLGPYVSAMREKCKSTAEGPAILYKMARDQLTLNQRADAMDPDSPVTMESEYQFWKDRELAPIAVASGSVVMASEGRIYDAAKFQFQPQFKMPNPYMQGCVSHNFNPEGSRFQYFPPASLRFDTIIYAYYIGDSLKTVRFCRDDRTVTLGEENDFDECMLQGSWTQTFRVGRTGMLGQFYTTEIDEREDAPEGETVVKISGVYDSVDSVPYASFDYFTAMAGSMQRNHYFMHTTDTKTTGSKSLNIGLCVPYLMPGAVIHAKTKATTSEVKSWRQDKIPVGDPYTYSFFTYDFIGHWHGGYRGMAYEPWPKDGYPIWVSQEHYSEGECTSFVNKGPWSSPGQELSWLANYGISMHFNRKPPAAYTPRPKTGKDPLPARSESKANIYETSLTFSGTDQTWKLDGPPANMYFLGSPDDIVGVFIRSATKNSMGEAEFVTVTEAAEGRDPAQRGHTVMKPASGMPYFIGVING